MCFVVVVFSPTQKTLTKTYFLPQHKKILEDHVPEAL